LVRITISGHPGSGTSTLVALLCERFGLSSLNGGDVFREQASQRGMSLADFGELCKQDDSIDRELDQLLRERMFEGPEIIESRLSGWWAFKDGHDCVRLWLEVSLDERARRLSGRESLDFETALESMTKRELLDDKRFLQMYGFTPADREPYTHVVEASNMSANEVADTVAKFLEE